MSEKSITCKDCGKEVPAHGCKSCAIERVSTCTDCGYVANPGEPTFKLPSGAMLCETCYGKDEQPASRAHGHYYKDVSHLQQIDVYRILELYEVTDPCLQHIVKKALCAGKRGAKDKQKDIKEISDTALRALQMAEEDGV